jgi:AraC-like DNA-binding protein
MSAILVVATVQSWFLAALVASRRDRRLWDTVLVVWLGLMGLHTGLYYVLPRLEVSLPWVSALNSAFPFLQGPMLYFYVDTLTASRRRLPTSFLWHLLPAAAFVAYQAWILPTTPAGAHGGTRTLHIFSVSGFFTGLLLLSVPVYIAWSLLLIRRYRRRLAQAVSASEHIDLGWLRTLVGGLGLVWVVVLGTFLVRAAVGGDTAHVPTHLVFWALALFVYAIGYQAFRQRQFVSEPVAEILKAPPPDGAKYLKSGLSEAEARDLHERLLGVMEGERPWRDDSLDLPGLAAVLDTSANHVSQVLNGLEGRSFYDFVNGYRVAAVKERLADQGEGPSSLLDVALACGFRSKATFNRIFKQHTGLTPTQYRALR